MAAEFGFSIGTKISEYLVEPILIRPLRPIFCFQTIADDFQDQNKKLIAIQERVGNDVQRDRDNALVIYHHVEEWVQKVDASMQEVRRVKDGLDENNRCFRYSWCPSWTCHYSFSKKVSKMAATMKILCEEGSSFILVSHAPPLHQDMIESSSSASFMHFQSSRSAFDQIMEALKRDDTNLVGLYGRAGAGKTTMAQLVREGAQKLFNRVIMVPVSEHPQVRSQQGVIADFLGAPFDHQESEQGRAAKLQLRLNNGEKILIILDDVQEEFNLGAVIGITSSDSGCKFLLTANAEIHFHTQKHILLGALSEDEAWTLLKSTAGVGDEVRKHDVAMEALEECKGLPKAIVAMGTVLNGKDVAGWRETLQQHNAAKFKIIASLKEGVKKLSLRQDRVNTKIKMAEQNAEEIYPDVEKWLQDVERVMNDVEQFEMEFKKSIWCFDELGVATRVGALATSVKDRHEEGNFDQVSHPIPLEPDMRLFSSEDFLFTEVAKSAFDQILKAWKTDNINMIGLYGMGGIGKTTLASQVHNEVIRQNALAVMVTVSQKPNVINMQDKIADFLGLELKKKTGDERAIELKNRWKDEKILIILDDVWKRFDLRSIGITLDNCKGCKILMTTRGRDVCSSMECQAEIQLHMFSKDESQKFFKKKAGWSNELELDDVAKQIVAECKCLPIALETVGAALKYKDKEEWEGALDKLRNARLVDIIGVDEDEKNAYKCLQLSYDYLKGQAQFLLLLCSLFPEDYEIEVADLTRYAFGVVLFESVSSLKVARREVRGMIRLLKDSCLLLDIGGEEYVKLHDVVRDAVLWIGSTESKERNTLTVRDGIRLKDLIRKKRFQNCKALSFMSDVIPKFSKYSELEFPNLEIVLIFGKCAESVELGEGLFERMKLLKVLDVRGPGRWRRCKFAIPQSLHCLEYLRTLMLRNCELSNSSVLRDLGRLRILSLNGSIIDCGVEVVSIFKKLRLLDLSELEAERRMCTSSDVIEALVKLEELYGYTVEECEDGEGTSSRLSELKLPSNLVAMSARVEDVRCLPMDFCFPNLQSYDIHIGLDYAKPSSVSQGRHLEVHCDVKDESMMINTCKKLFPTVQVFRLSLCDDLYSLPGQELLQKLEMLEVHNCSNMEYLFQVGNVLHVQILSLKVLHLLHLSELEHIWKGPTARLLSLCNLTKVEIIDCPKLIRIFSSRSLAPSLPQLEILHIQSCDNLEEVFSRSGGSDDDDDDFTCCCFANLRELKVFICHKVKTIFPLMKSAGKAPHLHPQSPRCRLPKLETVLLECNNELEHIFGHQTQAEEGVECPSLQVLEVTCCPNFVATQLQAPSSKSYKDYYSMNNIQIVEEQLQRRHDDLPQNTIICFSFLYRIELKYCNKLKQVFTTSLAISLHLLEVLILKRCSELEQVFSTVDDGKEELAIGVFFENLKTLRVSRCGKLKTIFPNSIVLPELEVIKLKSNAELEHVFGRSDWDCTWQCPFLKDLCLKDCPKLCTEFAACIQYPSTAEVKLGHTQGEEVKCILKRSRGPTQNICFTNLCQIRVIGCIKLKHLFTTKIATKFPKLKRLIVRRCSELEVIMVEDGKEEKINDATTEMIPKVGFENLEVLHVSDCKKLKTVFSTFKPLPKLDTLLLQRNAALESLFGPSDCDCTLHWTRLNMLSVAGCPKLCRETIVIVKRQLQAQSPTQESCIINLSNIHGVEELVQFQRQDEGDVNEKIQHQKYEDDDDDKDEEEEKYHMLKLEELGDLKRIWSGPTQDISFSYLGALRVIGCSRLKHLFTTTMATSLRNLSHLSVERCCELEQVIQEEGNEENTMQSVQQLDFSKLGILRLIDLPNLISFCPTSCNLVFTNLIEKNLKVKGCAKPITDFFSKQSYKEEEEEEEYGSEGEDEDDGKFQENDKYEYDDEDKDEYDSEGEDEEDGKFQEKDKDEYDSEGEDEEDGKFQENGKYEYDDEDKDEYDSKCEDEEDGMFQENDRYEYDYEGEDEDDGKFQEEDEYDSKDEDEEGGMFEDEKHLKYCTDKFVAALFGLPDEE